MFFINQKDAKSVTIGGVRSLIDFSTDGLHVRVQGGSIEVIGERLKIEYFNSSEIKVTGKIQDVKTNKASTFRGDK
ncbi:MAG: YabP/YqfC family sporulation protein [Firmicutes bacterium]|nr:YabP/YqfC family sporulation protein [Bacillota bacterium]